MSAPIRCTVVVDKNGMAWAPLSSMRAEDYDARYPHLAPHRLVPMVEAAELERAVQERDALSYAHEQIAEAVDLNALHEDARRAGFLGGENVFRAVPWLRKSLAESEARCAIYVAALERLSKLGNGERPGNSLGNEIAQNALRDAALGLEGK